MQTRSPELPLDEIINTAKTKFIPGYKIRETINNKFKTTADLKMLFMEGDLYYDGDTFSSEEKPGFKKIVNKYFFVRGYPNYQDPHFTINANVITDTPFIASEGPQNLYHLGQFFENTVFNQKLPIKKVVALGECLSDGHHYQDFYEYCLYPRDEIAGSYLFSVEDKHEQNYTINILGSQFCPAKNVIQSHLTIYPQDAKESELDVTLIKLKDNYPIHLTSDTKEALWKIYNDSKNENILIHCASGIGRTGHLIFTLELLRHYKAIYEAENVEIAAEKIMEIVNRLRKDRFCLIHVEEQFTYAISNAQELYKYGLEKGYIQKPAALVSTTPQTLFTKNFVAGNAAICPPTPAFPRSP